MTESSKKLGDNVDRIIDLLTQEGISMHVSSIEGALSVTASDVAKAVHFGVEGQVFEICFGFVGLKHPTPEKSNMVFDIGPLPDTFKGGVITIEYDPAIDPDTYVFTCGDICERRRVVRK